MCPQSPQNKKVKTLKKRSDFLKSYRGPQVRKEFLILYYSKNNTGGSRLGITIPKTTGTAVVRNKIKRWVKEEFRKLVKTEQPLDFHFFVKSKSKSKDDYKNLKFLVIKKEIGDAIAQVLRNF